MEDDFRENANHALPNARAQKKCPYCAEGIPSDAVMCCYCGESLGRQIPVAAAPQAKGLPTGVVVAIVIAVMLPVFFAIIAIIAAIAIPNLLESKKAANEASAISVLRTISVAQEMYYSKYETYAEMQNLAGAGMVDERISRSMDTPHGKSGYYFKIRLEGDGWSATAMPVSPGQSGERSFYIDDTNEIYYEICISKNDKPADRTGKLIGGR